MPALPREERLQVLDALEEALREHVRSEQAYLEEERLFLEQVLASQGGLGVDLSSNNLDKVKALAAKTIFL